VKTSEASHLRIFQTTVALLYCAGCGGGGHTAPDSGIAPAGASPSASDPRGMPPSESSSPSPAPDARPTAGDAGGTVDLDPGRLPPTEAGVLPDLLAPADTRPASAETFPSLADSGPEAGSARLDAPPDATADLLRADLFFPDLPRADLSPPEAGREAGAELRPPCPQSCLEGCGVGCGAGGQCQTCATCTCEVVTGSCHC
jgi:hypothetical protein